MDLLAAQRELKVVGVVVATLARRKEPDSSEVGLLVLFAVIFLVLFLCCFAMPILVEFPCAVMFN